MNNPNQRVEIKLGGQYILSYMFESVTGGWYKKFIPISVTGITHNTICNITMVSLEESEEYFHGTYRETRIILIPMLSVGELNEI